jgi:acetoacetyl-CoA synthetase
MSTNRILWQASPEQIRATAMHHFMRKHGFDNYDGLYQWSIDESAAFWESLCEFCGVRFDTPATKTLSRPDDIMDAGWFAGSKLNYAAHLLRHEGDRAAIIFYGESGVRRELSFEQLRQAVADVAAGLRNCGVIEGDRVAGFLPNCPEAIIAMLATTSLGATWSSCSPDFGVNGVVDRFGQIEPKVLFATNGYFYNGKRIDSLPVVAGIVDKIPSIAATVISPFLSDNEDLSAVSNAVEWREYDRYTKVHCSRSRRIPAAASQRACLAHRYLRPGSCVLFHDLRLDDVELAGKRVGYWSNVGALRRFAVF